MFEAGIVFPYIFQISLTIVYNIVTSYASANMQNIHIVYWCKESKSLSSASPGERFVLDEAAFQ